MGVMRHPISHFLAVYSNWCHVSQIHQRTPLCKFLHSTVAELPKGSGETWGEMFIMGFIYWRKQLSHLVGGSQRRSETRRSPSALDFKSPKLACSFICLSLCTEQHDHCLPPKPQLPAGDKREAQCSRGEGKMFTQTQPAWSLCRRNCYQRCIKLLKGRIACHLTGNFLNLRPAVFLPRRTRDSPPPFSSAESSLAEAEPIRWLALGTPVKC